MSMLGLGRPTTTSERYRNCRSNKSLGYKGLVLMYPRTSFLWAFSPQIDRLHPTERADINIYSATMRQSSRWVARRDLSHKRRAEPLQGLATFMKFETIEDVLEPAMSRWQPREMSYNLTWVYKKQQATYNANAYKSKRTIEFRQHEGCVDGIAVINVSNNVQQAISMFLYFVTFNVSLHGA
jgi:hypothetical protein